MNSKIIGTKFLYLEIEIILPVIVIFLLIKLSIESEFFNSIKSDFVREKSSADVTFKDVYLSILNAEYYNR